ncbi:MAG: hypothetical protein R2861_12795 [Desulfobacterales bacterium]
MMARERASENKWQGALQQQLRSLAKIAIEMGIDPDSDSAILMLEKPAY